MGVIVVGVDGSDGSVRALRFAYEEARLHGADVKAISAWHIPPAAYEAGWVPVPIDLGSFEAASRATLDKTLETAGAPPVGVAVTAIVREGQAADILLAEARGADLLVVGSRGLGGFRSLMLGSVSQQVVHHAPCPVVVVPVDFAEAHPA